MKSEVEKLDLPGRNLRWLVNADELLGAKHCSICVIRVAPGETVRPAHSHPNGEEVIYIVSGSGRVMVDGEVSPVRAGIRRAVSAGRSAHAAEHRRREMKVVCFFAPATKPDNYKFFEDVEFPA